ncbi:hypothetical protein AAG747_22035 [Rapidithrix thailandica]|uniref:HMA domain-containing protein n=1 Tax=Rapidithrix thailandica TaxID=413964 RepID=A0AAW9S615_9BACT
MVEVFKTDVQEEKLAQKIISELLRHFPGCEINFDLEDCDKILRVETTKNIFSEVIATLTQQGIRCEILD